jgi:hypothetical protein
MMLLLWDTSFKNGYHTVKEFVCFAFGKCYCNWQLQWERTGLAGIDPVSVIHPTNYGG